MYSSLYLLLIILSILLSVGGIWIIAFVKEVQTTSVWQKIVTGGFLLEFLSSLLNQDSKEYVWTRQRRNLLGILFIVVGILCGYASYIVSTLA